jgi:peptidoglycan/LPS O-acetylase OafA/YrhL
VTRVFEHAAFRRVSRAVNARAYSLYLWGPVANEIAVRVLERVPSGGVALYLVLAVLLLLGLVRIFGRVEDWAAGRGDRREEALRPVPAPVRER